MASGKPYRTPVSRGMKGYVYVAQCRSGGLVKIGFSGNPWKRVSQLKWQYQLSEPMRVIALLEGRGKDEVEIHAFLDSSWVDTERYNPTKELYELIHSDPRWVIYNDLILTE